MCTARCMCGGGLPLGVNIGGVPIPLDNQITHHPSLTPTTLIYPPQKGPLTRYTYSSPPPPINDLVPGKPTLMKEHGIRHTHPQKGPGTSGTHTSVDRMTDRHLWKHYLHATTVAGYKKTIKYENDDVITIAETPWTFAVISQ